MAAGDFESIFAAMADRAIRKQKPRVQEQAPPAKQPQIKRRATLLELLSQRAMTVRQIGAAAGWTLEGVLSAIGSAARSGLIEAVSYDEDGMATYRIKKEK